jgi:membrane-bound serine protease (ClpP class)
MRVSRLISTVCLCLSPALAFAEDPASGPIYKVVVDDVIHAVSAQHIIDTIAEANAHDAELVLIQLSTPGGLYQATQQIIAAIFASKRPVVVYVAPAGVHAASAGFLILLSADVAAMAPGTNTGASTPVSGTGQELDETMQKKVQSDAAAYTRSIAERRGKDPALAEQAVTEARSWTAKEALDAGLVDYIASSQEDLLAQLDGKTVTRIDGSEVTLSTAGRAVELKEMTTKERILSFVANPNVAVLLGLIGLAGLYLEFTNPGAILPGVVGAISLLLAAFAFQILPVNAVGALLMVVGFGLIIAEALTPSFGALGAGGIIGVLLGAFILIEEQPLPTPALRVSWAMILPVTILLSLVVIVVGRKVVAAQRHRPVTGSEGLIGKMAIARTPIDLEGKVFIHGEFWDARSNEPIAEGERVRVTSVEGLLLGVERTDNDS